MSRARIDVADIKLRVPVSRTVKSVGRLTGFDTETLKTGYAFLIALGTGQHAWVRGVEDVIPFVTSGLKHVCFNMDFDAAAVMKWFGEDFCRELLEKGRATYRDIHVQYVPRKYLYFRVGNKWTMFWDVSQFFAIQGRRVTLASAAKWVKMKKGDFPVADMDESFYGNQQLLEYCVHDAAIVGALGRLVVKQFEESGIVVTSLASPATIVESYIIDQSGIRIPSMIDVPEEALQYAESAVMPPWREFFKRGLFRRMYDYDISSAYPSVIRNLPDLKYGVWEYKKGGVPKRAKLGYVKCNVSIPPDDYVSWVNYRNRFGDNFTPTGRFSTVLTLNGLRHVKATVIDGWYWVSNIERPLFKRIVDSLYALKAEASRTSFRRHLLKVLLASVYGKFHQVLEDGSAGRLYNPFYTAEVMTDARLKVYELARVNPQSLIGIHTDCVYSTDKLDVQLGEHLGSWELRGVSSMLVIGLNHFEKGTGYLRYALGREPNKAEYIAKYGKGLRPMSLPEALRSGQFEDTNVFLPFEEKINVVKQVYKRRWLSLPTCGKDLLDNIYDSRPFPVGIANVLGEGEKPLWEVGR